MKNTLFIFFTILTISSIHAQGESCASQVDSMIISSTSQEFRDLFGDVVLNNNLFRIDSGGIVSSYCYVSYTLRDRLKFKYLHYLNEDGGYGPFSLLFNLDKNCRIPESKFDEYHEKLKKYQRVLEKFGSSKFMSIREAKRICKKSKTKGYHMSKDNGLLSYNEKSENFEYRFEVGKGRKVCEVQSLWIDAVTGKVRRDEPEEIHRSGWDAFFRRRHF